MTTTEKLNYPTKKKGFDGDEDSTVFKGKKEYEHDKDVKESSLKKKSSLPLSLPENGGSDESLQSEPLSSTCKKTMLTLLILILMSV
eukprot:CAMPEP_0171302662 /NCGR_PEP_ID=MMETSP0816-20121228/12087_1 /TAXON_ID=420281 /ORGANISM="Proboscia inermis, Strain CCAP1064/1" /LENGTH=86 /DNA_ID=CAMNT_0011781301 /DNA_START=472 /DNA_END=732 /DNA_ORIENTATION=+